MIEYDVTLTGLVARQQMHTLDETKEGENPWGGNPLQLIFDLGKRSVHAVLRLVRR